MRGATEADDDVYVMTNAYWEPVRRMIQAPSAPALHRIVDTSLARPHDIVEPGQPGALGADACVVGARSVAALMTSQIALQVE